TAHIFGTDTPGYAGDDENWTRVQLIASGPDQSTVAPGTFGSFQIDEATGAWTYTFNNDSPAAQALGHGIRGTDNFNVRLTDEHGQSSSRQFTFTVVGTAEPTDPPPAALVIQTPDPTNNPNQQIITGTQNADLITGGASNDLLTGHGGADTFDYNNIADVGDTISDFSTAQGDKLDVHDLMLSLLGHTPNEAEASQFMSVGNFTQVGGRTFTTL